MAERGGHHPGNLPLMAPHLIAVIVGLTGALILILAVAARGLMGADPGTLAGGGLILAVGATAEFAALAAHAVLIGLRVRGDAADS